MFIEKLKEEAVFSFQCQCCGNCCCSGLEIYLNPLDVWRLRNNLKAPTSEMKEKYLVIETRSEYGQFPLCLIKMNGESCPFLDGRLCSAHPGRPSSCRIHPIVHFFDENRDSSFSMSPDLDRCPGMSKEKTYILTGWLAINMFHLNNDLLDFYVKMIKKFDMRSPIANLEALFDILYNFDNVEDFPFKEYYPGNRDSDNAYLEWVISKASMILGI